ncbi:phasin family protein [Rehaibacterium terrae]|uniref:Translation elongation factor EF-Ts n=1 Tax=Rehaibacterium terrae TaxID=1341696 RepID=A0A7W8DE33_9GAMM|nr:phasin family protein [Rehaibacterium terrae]MBB5015465.1 translation elongation factor EF-Ts [Rehaibacterium terrae]
MYEQINAQFVSMTKQMADSALKASALAFENFERVVGLQIKTAEDRINANIAFLGEAAEVRDFEGLKTIWPKGVQLAKENAERFYGAQQEAVGQTLKTQEAIGQLIKAQFEAAGEQVAKAAAKAPKAAR